MPILKNSRHEKFAQLVAGGMTASEAYTKAGYTIPGAYTNGPRLTEHDQVAARILELKARSEAKADITRGEIIKILGGYARSHPDDYPHDTRLKAINQLTKMCGWDSPSEVKLSVDNELTELLQRLRGGG